MGDHSAWVIKATGSDSTFLPSLSFFERLEWTIYVDRTTWWHAIWAVGVGPQGIGATSSREQEAVKMAGGLCLRACSLHGSQPGGVAFGIRCLVSVAGVLIALSNVGAGAEQRFEPGDEVEVAVFSSWLPGTVLEVDRRGAVGVEYKFAGSYQQRVFPQNQVRMRCEVDGLGLVREWQDASGNFRIRAALIRYSGEQITLCKIDMEEIEVPVSALSSKDQRYLAKIKKTIPGGSSGSGGLAPVERFAGSAGLSSSSKDGPGSPFPSGFGSDQMPGFDVPPIPGFDKPRGNRSRSGAARPDTPNRGKGSTDSTVSSENANRQALAPDPMPAHLKFNTGGAAFPVERMGPTVGAVIPVGGQQGWILASLEGGLLGPATGPTRLVWVSLSTQKVEKNQTLPVDDMVLDYHAPSHRLLTCTRAELGTQEGKQILSVWEVLPTDEGAQSIVRWETSWETMGGARTPWAKLVGGDLVIQCTAEKEFVAWDLAKKNVRYRIEQDSAFAPVPALSGTRKYFAMPEMGRVRLFEASTGVNVSTLPIGFGANAVTFSDDGRLLAVLEGSNMSIWDLTDAEAKPRKLQAEAIRGALSMTWLDDQHMIVDRGHFGMALFSLEESATLWSYAFGLDVNTQIDTSRSRCLIRDHLVYAARINQSLQTGLAVGAVKLPGSDAEQAMISGDPSTLLLFKPGSPIRIEVHTGSHDAQVRASLERKVKENGWKLDPSSPNVLIAEIKQGQQRQKTYTFHGRRPNETVSYTPYNHTLRIKSGEDTAWEIMTSLGAPWMISIREDSSVQEVINRSEKTSPSFFEKAKIPERILDPKKRGGFGTSNVTNRGLVTVQPDAEKSG